MGGRAWRCCGRGCGTPADGETPAIAATAIPVFRLTKLAEEPLFDADHQTPAAVAPKNDGGCAEASRSSAGADTRSFPGPRLFKASGSSLRGGRPVLACSRPGQVVRGRSHGAYPFGPPRCRCCKKRGAAGGPSRRRAAGVAAYDARSGFMRSLLVRASSCGLNPSAPVRPRLAGRPRPSQCLRNWSISKTLFLKSM